MSLESAYTTQSLFLKRIEDLIGNSSSLVFEMSEILNISTDSAYRRMRGETMLSIDEIIKLCDRFNVSFDAFTRVESGLVTFAYSEMEGKTDNLLDYLKGVLKDLKNIVSIPDSHIIYACQDIPVFYHYNHPEIAAFKFFYWMRSIMNVNDANLSKFNPDVIDSEIYETAKEIYSLYSKVPSTEIWTDTTMHSTLKQIEFYWDAGVFNSAAEAIAVCESLKQEILSIQHQAETSAKDSAESVKKYELYYSEIEITNNCVLINLGFSKAVYLSHFSFYTMKTMNETYCRRTEDWLKSLIKKTTLISGVSEKIRFQFFNKAYSAIDKLINKISNTSI